VGLGDHPSTTAGLAGRGRNIGEVLWPFKMLNTPAKCSSVLG